MIDAIDIEPDDLRLPELRKLIMDNGSYGIEVLAKNFLAWHHNQLEGWERDGIIKWQV